MSLNGPKQWLACALLSSLPLWGLTQPADAQTPRLNQTVEGPASQSLPGLELSGGQTVPGIAQRLVSGRPLQQFRIFDARVLLSRDEDGDGFYHRLRVIFDADVDLGDALVFAQIYLSYEGGPWNHVFTTDVFHILEDVPFDDYEVVTRLLEGYPEGHYDLLIELYDADWDQLVASYGPNEDPDLALLPLEDQGRDALAPLSVSHGGGGALDLASLLLLGLFGGISARSARPRDNRGP